jgi:hypothetical protein
MHRLKWEWDSITTFNQFVASFVHPLRSKMSEVLLYEEYTEQSGCTKGTDMSSTQKAFLATYLGLLALCTVLLVVGVLLDSATSQKYLVEVASDAFKTVLGAAIGALSTLLNTTVSRQKAS